MNLCKRKGKVNKTWQYRALVVDLSKTRVVFGKRKKFYKNLCKPDSINLVTVQHSLHNVILRDPNIVQP